MRTTILALDQDPFVCATLHASLGIHGIDVVCTGRPDDIVQLAREVKPAAIIIDMTPAGRPCMKAVTQLREQGFSQTPMIATSTSPVMLEVAALYDYFSGYFQKPLDLKNLVAYIVEVSEQSQ